MASDLQQRFSEAKALETDGQYARAEDIYAQLTAFAETGIRARRRRTECLIRLQRWDEARDEVAAVFAAERPNNRDIKRWLSVRARLGDAARPADPVVLHARAQRQAHAYPEGPFALFTAAAPKTGSTSLSVALAAALGGAKINYLDLPPTSHTWGSPWWPAVDALNGCAVVNHCHLSPAPEVMAEFASRPWLKIAVHLRNPFETMESTIDMMIRQRSPNLLSGTPHLADAPDAALRDHAMNHYLARLGRWMGDWLALADAGHPSVLGLSTMDDMRRDGQDAVARRFVGALPGMDAIQADTAPQRTGNRLSGDKTIRLTDGERHAVATAMPAGLLDRFGWS